MSIQKASQGLASKWAAGDTLKHFREQATVHVGAGSFFSGAGEPANVSQSGPTWNFAVETINRK